MGSVSSSTTSGAVPVLDVESLDDVLRDKKESAKHDVMMDQRGKKISQSRRMQRHLRGMRWRLKIIQKLMQEATWQSRFRFTLQVKKTAAGGSCVSSTVAVLQAKDRSADVQILKPTTCVDESLRLVSGSFGRSADNVSTDTVNCDRRGDDGSSTISSDEDEPQASATRTLQTQINLLQTRLQDATDENQQLQSTVQRLTQENARLEARTNPSYSPDDCCKGDGGSTTLEPRDQDLHDKVDDDNDDDDDQNRKTACSSTATCGGMSAFQLIMLEDMKALRNHEQCQRKLHELWDTVWKLKAFVEAYALERNLMKLQRDDALAEAERADAENVKLASSGNLQQKIKYLEQLKNDNRSLRRKNRAMNVRIAKYRAELVRAKSGCSLSEDRHTTAIETTDSASLDDVLHELGEPAVRTDEEILRSMRDFSRFLEQRLMRLRLAKQDLVASDEGSMEQLRFSNPRPVIREPSGRTST
ncbi:unnamed protein product [Hyaloperonospora brassicae]|uniref:Uncharacterized protein n=1 Tax=Hyaloperonospora brassicae TaxID=162125 RepID=A0AAV0TGI9_HYABA|nr:unnamed protein product [Hyaloperonospora brassicae]